MLYISNNRFKAFLTLFGTLILLLQVRPLESQDNPIESKPVTSSPHINRKDKDMNDRVKILGGKILLDGDPESTGVFQFDKYTNFVNISTPSLTPSSGHTLLFANSDVNQLIAKFSDGSTTVLGKANAGTITGVTAGTDLTGGGTSGTVTLNVNEANVLTTSSATATYLNNTVAGTTYITLSSTTANYCKSTGANCTSTASIFQSVSSGTTVTTSNATISYVATNLSKAITPSSSSHRIKITVNGELTMATSGSVKAFATLFRNSSELSISGKGFCATGASGGTASSSATCAFTYIDSPATTGATTYTVEIKAGTVSNTSRWNEDNIDSWMLLEEIN